MPVIRYVPCDPTDRVIQGEQMRQSVFDPVDLEQPSAMIGAFFQTALAALVRDDDAYPPMNSFICLSRLAVRRQKSGELQMRVNAGIVTPCGAWVFNDWPPLLIRFEQASVRWAVAGVTKDSAGAALGSCRVVALETGRISQENVEASVGETISDGSGNYSIPVPMNTAYQLTAYKAGSPDVAGITRNDVVPAAIG